MGHTMLRSIIRQIKTSMWFALIADEASDISRNEHMCISIHWLNSWHEVSGDPFVSCRTLKLKLSLVWLKMCYHYQLCCAEAKRMTE